MPTQRSKEQQARRQLAAKGLQLVKPRPGGRFTAEYGPYYVVDIATSGVVAKGLDLDGALALGRSDA